MVTKIKKLLLDLLTVQIAKACSVFKLMPDLGYSF